MPVFVDTNVLVYARVTSDPGKHRTALDWMTGLWESGTGRLSIQVLQEYYVTVTRKLRPALSRIAARADVRDLLAWDPVPIGGRTDLGCVGDRGPVPGCRSGTRSWSAPPPSRTAPIS